MQNSKLKSTNKNSKVDLKERAYQLSIRAITFMSDLRQTDIVRIICNQLIRSITSIGANIIEAQSASSRKEFINYYQIALKSANESKYWLCLIRDTELADTEKVAPLLNETIEISRMLASSILTLKGKKR